MEIGVKQLNSASKNPNVCKRSSSDEIRVWQMAPKKLSTKRASKAPAGEGSNAAPQAEIEFDGHRFRSEEHQHCFEVIKDWSFL